MGENNNTDVVFQNISGDKEVLEAKCRNFFSGCTYQWTPICSSQLATVTATCVVYLLVIAVNGGIIVYENVVPDTYRTLINKVVALMSAYNMFLSTSFMPIALSKHFCIQLNPTYCTGNVLLTTTFLLQVILVHNELAILLNLSTWKVGFIQGINEDIGRRIIIALNFALSAFFSLNISFSFGGKITFIYRLCVGNSTGTPPLTCSSHRRMWKTFLFLLQVTLTLGMALS